MLDKYIKINYKDIDPIKIKVDNNLIKYNDDFFKIKTPVLNGKIIDRVLYINENKLINTNFLIYKEKITNILKIIEKSENSGIKYIINENSKLFDKNKVLVSIKNLSREEINFIAFIIITRENIYIDKLLEV